MSRLFRNTNPGFTGLLYIFEQRLQKPIGKNISVSAFNIPSSENPGANIAGKSPFEGLPDYSDSTINRYITHTTRVILYVQCTADIFTIKAALFVDCKGLIQVYTPVRNSYAELKYSFYRGISQGGGTFMNCTIEQFEDVVAKFKYFTESVTIALSSEAEDLRQELIVICAELLTTVREEIEAGSDSII